MTSTYRSRRSTHAKRVRLTVDVSLSPRPTWDALGLSTLAWQVLALRLSKATRGNDQWPPNAADQSRVTTTSATGTGAVFGRTISAAITKARNAPSDPTRTADW